ncbi:serine/threonine protein kinase, partial [Piscinibacter sp.]|uniref:serine/threonine protein kinase n=1 Tax=Piscinibacter sp. TaxID=1903157 RepID=UPI00355A9D24
MSQVPSFDDEPTIAPRASIPRGLHGRFVGSSSFFSHTLPEGTSIGGLEIIRLIGEGGFGIVYLADDPALQRQVAIKEYMPSSLAARASDGLNVVLKSDHHADTFKVGLRSFVNEARLLASFDHPALVKVYSFWEANGTAYMAMPYYEGPTLKRTVIDMGHAPDEATLRAWLRPLLDALAVMHREHCFHRDIAPDNILLTATGPLLLDFGAARRVIGDMTHALTAMLKPGYAPIEQYGEMSAMRQGAWTDLYALACVVYFAVTGKPPMSSVDRLMAEGLAPLGRVAAGRYSESFLRAIDAALAVQPQDRPQDVAQFRALLDAGLAQRAGAAVAPLPRPIRDKDETTLMDPPAQAAPRAAVAAVARALAPATPATAPVAVAVAVAAGATPARRSTVYAVGAAVFLAAAAAGLLLVRPRPAP